MKYPFRVLQKRVALATFLCTLYGMIAAYFYTQGRWVVASIWVVAAFIWIWSSTITVEQAYWVGYKEQLEKRIRNGTD